MANITKIKWYGWSIIFIPGRHLDMAEFIISEDNEKTITAKIKSTVSDEDYYEVANKAIKWLLEDSKNQTRKLEAITAQPNGSPVVLYQDSNVNPGKPQIEFDDKRKFYIVRMASPRYATGIEKEKDKHAKDYEKLGDVKYRMDPRDYAESFSVLIYYKEFPVPLLDTELNYPGTIYNDAKNSSISIQHAFQPNNRTSINIGRIKLLKYGRIDGTWNRLTRMYGFWEMMGLNFLVKNKAETKIIEGYLTNRRGFNISQRDQVYPSDLSTVGTAALKVSPSGNKGFGGTATRKLLRGTWIGEYLGDVRTISLNDETNFSYVYELGKVYPPGENPRLLIVDSEQAGGNVRFLNHTCYQSADLGGGKYSYPGPNADLFSVWYHGSVSHNQRAERKVLVRVMRDIKNGEEVTVNYGKNYELDKCLCNVCKK